MTFLDNYSYETLVDFVNWDRDSKEVRRLLNDIDWYCGDDDAKYEEVVKTIEEMVR